MSQFKLRSEIGADGEFIAFLEQIRSGGDIQGSPGVGTNRALERLAENDDALIEALQAVRFPWQISEGGTVLHSPAGQVDWDADLLLSVVSEINSAAIQNKISAATVSLAVGDVAYVVLDRTTNDAVVAVSTQTLANYLTVVLPAAVAAGNRLDYMIVCTRISASVVVFPNGQRLRDGYQYTDGFARDSQYGQQTELTIVHDNQLENWRTFITGGGNITWDADTDNLNFGDDLIIDHPSYGGENRVLPGNQSIGTGEVLYVTLLRKPGLTNDVVPIAVANGSVPNTDDILVLAIRGADDRLYLFDGSALSDGETILLGGARTGVNWIYKQVGGASQRIDFTLPGPAPGNQYKVGSGELMVYRNGIKAKASALVWNGEHPGGGLEAGVLDVEDDYVEEDPGTGIGTKIIWLADDAGTPGHPVDTKDPNRTYPGVDDRIEAFVGIQGAVAEALNVADLAPIQGFETMWTRDGSTLRMAGGVLLSAGIAYRSLIGVGQEIDLDITADAFGIEVPSANTWRFVYLGPGATPGALPVGKHSILGPTVSASEPFGAHPTDTDYKFLGTVWVNATTLFSGMAKEGSRVILGSEDKDATTPFDAVLPNAAFQTIDLDLNGVVPASGVPAVRLVLRATVTGGVVDGQAVQIETRHSSSVNVTRKYSALKPVGSTTVEFEFEVPLGGASLLDILVNATDFATVDDVRLLGYSEGRFSTSAGLV